MGKRAEVKGLYYITHVENVPSILERGVLSHAYIESHHIPFKPIYDEAIVSNRKNKPTPDRPSLWEYANVYFQPRNPMMYRVVKEKGPTELAVIGITSDVLNVPEVLVTDGNAASHATQFYRPAEGLAALDRHVIRSEYWKNEDGSKRKIMAECLVPERIPPERIDAIYVADHETKERVRAIATREIHIIPEPHLFFTPSYRKKIGANITLVEGDMFFSEMQTLTVSVNLQGIMGKGLASRKYQFPDVYVRYQDACRARQVTATKPFLYKREASLDEELADLSTPLHTPNATKWFLLFATKRKWRENSRIEDIEGGLSWLRDNFQSQGVMSIAMPALGCGLGGLDWADVGPLMCRYLAETKIPVAIYLPRERPTDPMLLEPSFLLPSG